MPQIEVLLGFLLVIPAGCLSWGEAGSLQQAVSSKSKSLFTTEAQRKAFFIAYAPQAQQTKENSVLSVPLW